MITAADVEKTFFDSIQEGWGSDALKERTAKLAERIAIPELSPFGFTAIRWGRGKGPWLVLDSWLELPYSSGSFGFTVIGHSTNTDPGWRPAVWYMQYGGWYKEHVIPFVQRALHVNYSQRIFFGGRGPSVYREGSLVYRNRPAKNEFRDFYGDEEVLEGDTPAGFHWYRGRLLLPTEERRYRGHNEISTICRRILVDDRFFANEYAIPVIPWDKLIYDFASDQERVELTEEELGEKFRTDVVAKA